MKFLPLIVIAMLIATGCLPRQPRPAVLNEALPQRTFFRYLDAETATERESILQEMQRDFAQSPLTARAVELEKIAAGRAEQQAKIKKLAAESKHCREETAQLEKANADLRKDLDQLKQLVIEMEMRAR